MFFSFCDLVLSKSSNV